MKQPLQYTANNLAIKGYTDSPLAKSETRDCVVRAIASCFDIEYDSAHKFVKETFSRQNRRGTFNTAQKLVRLVDRNFTLNGKSIHTTGVRNNSSMIGSLRYDVIVKGKKTKREMTVGKFVQDNPTGTFFMLVRGHAFTIKDGVVIGNPEDAKKLKRVVRCAFLIK
jgi:hypothetical protein